MTRILCIGGPRDGDWVDILDSDEIFACAYNANPQPVPSFEEFAKDPRSSMVTLTRAYYRRMPWQIDEYRTSILVINGMSHRDALHRLFRLYRGVPDLPRGHPPLGEVAYAVDLAGHILADLSRDPDSDIVVLARQLLRAREQIDG